jgi:hypothetical protein
MKTENSRLGRCTSCRYWKSAADLLAERSEGARDPSEVEAIRLAIRIELTQDLLNADLADYRGWCQAAELGTTGPYEMLSINMLSGEPARMITAHDYGCMNYQARPRRAMNAPPLDLTKNPFIGRCGACRNWSSAENEAEALLAMARYTDPNATIETAEKEAIQRLSPPPFDVKTGRRRGWCKIASDYTNANARNLTVDPASGAIGALITDRDYACIRHQESADPRLKTSPNWRMLVDRTKVHNLGVSAPINELLWSYLDPATLLDASHPLSPLHPEHPLNIRNPKSLYYNPNPAFAAYVINPSIVNTVIDPMAYEMDKTGVKSAGLEDVNHPRHTMQFAGYKGGDIELAQKQLMAQARLAQDFASRTLKRRPVDLDSPTAAGVSLTKKKSGPDDGWDRRKKRVGSFVKRPQPGTALDRRKD